MKEDNDRINYFLYVFEGVGAVFAGIFLVAYLGGLFMIPQTTVLHSDLAFRVPLGLFGVFLLELVWAGVVLALYLRRK